MRRSRRWSRWGYRLVAVFAVGAVASPAFTRRDSFPLSTYPIYAGARASTAELTVAVGLEGLEGLDAGGTGASLPMDIVAGTDDPLIAEAVLRNAVRDGRADELCRRVAGRLRPPLTHVEIADERHDVVARATGEPSLLERTVRARCEVH